MSQYEPNVAPGKSFISKINSKFSNLSLSSGIQNIHSDKDGSSNEDTLIHNAFVRYFDTNGQPYPEWLGVKTQVQSRQTQSPYTRNNYQQLSEFQPVRTSYNTGSYNQPNDQYQPQAQQSQSQYQPQQSQQQPQQQQQSQDNGDTSRRPLAYTPRSSSKLFDLYNKSRQQAVPGAGYNAQASTAAPGPARSNTSGAHSSRVRERMMTNSSSMNNLHQASTGASSNSSGSTGGSRATWGKRG